MTRPSAARRSAALLAAVSAVASAPACTSSAGTRPAVPTRPATTRPATTKLTTSRIPTPSLAAPSLPAATDIPNSVVRRRQMTLTACRSAPGGWEASGTAVNPKAAATTYVVTVFFTTTKGTVIGYARTAVRTPGHGRAAWRATGRFTAPATTLCVLRGVG